MKIEKIIIQLLDKLSIETFGNGSISFVAKTIDGNTVTLVINENEISISIRKEVFIERIFLLPENITGIYLYGYSEPHNTLKICTEFTQVELKLVKQEEEKNE